jgi:hypothetical protein
MTNITEQVPLGIKKNGSAQAGRIFYMYNCIDPNNIVCVYNYLKASNR